MTIPSDVPLHDSDTMSPPQYSESQLEESSPSANSKPIARLSQIARKPVPIFKSSTSEATLDSSDAGLDNVAENKVEASTAAKPMSLMAEENGLQELSHSEKEAGITHTSTPVYASLAARFNGLMPAHRRYLGRSRRTVLIVLAIIFTCLLALIIGLAAGLSQRKTSSSQNLPLPSNTGIFTGDITYYANELGLGACGLLSAATDDICAVSHILFDAASTSSNPNSNSLCGKMIRITRYDSTVGSNRSVDVKVIDRCVGCAVTDLDLSLGAFESVAEEVQGRVVGSWAWLE